MSMLSGLAFLAEVDAVEAKEDTDARGSGDWRGGGGYEDGG